MNGLKQFVIATSKMAPFVWDQVLAARKDASGI